MSSMRDEEVVEIAATPDGAPAMRELMKKVRGLQRRLEVLREKSPSYPRITVASSTFSLSRELLNASYTEETVSAAEDVVELWEQKAADREAAKAERRARKQLENDKYLASQAVKERFEFRLVELRSELTAMRRFDPKVPVLRLYRAIFSLGKILNKVYYTEQSVREIELTVKHWRQKVAPRMDAAAEAAAAERSRVEKDEAEERDAYKASFELIRRLSKLAVRLSALGVEDPDIPEIVFQPTHFDFGDVLTDALYNEGNVEIVREKVESWECAQAKKLRAEEKIRADNRARKTAAEKALRAERTRQQQLFKKLRTRLTVLRYRYPEVPNLQFWAAKFTFGATLRDAPYNDENYGVVEAEVLRLEAEAARQDEEYADRRRAADAAKAQRRADIETSKAAGPALQPRLKELRPRLNALRRKGLKVPQIRCHLTCFSFGYKLWNVMYTEENVEAAVRELERLEQEAPGLIRAQRRAVYEADRRENLTARYKRLGPRAGALGWALEFGDEGVCLLGPGGEVFPYTELGLVEFEEALEQQEGTDA